MRNDYFVRIPAKVLKQYSRNGWLEIQVRARRFAMEPRPSPRAGWFTGYVAGGDAMGTDWPEVLGGEGRDWTW